MRNTSSENLMEHSYQVAFIAHALAMIRNEVFGGSIEADRVVTVALYHDASEVITGDLPTPIKYNNSRIKEAYKELEQQADSKLLSMLPDYMLSTYKTILSPDNKSEEYAIVKAADKLSAYIKCLEELELGNNEFSVAKDSIEKQLKESSVPEVKYFIDKFIDGFFKPLDVL